MLRNVRDMRNGPILVHVVTQKGKGYGPAEISADKFHGVGKFNVVTGAQEAQAAGTPPSYTKVFANALIEEARADEKIVAITAAMPSGTGLDRFAETFPERCFDVGIAEQHAVTFAAGLAAEGYKPFAPSIRPSSSAPTTRSCMTWPCRACRSASPSTGPGWSAPTARPMPAPSTWPISPACRAWWSWRRPTRPS